MRTNQRRRGLSVLNSAKVRYIFQHGVLGWGLLTATLASLLDYYLNGAFMMRKIVIMYLTFPTVGVLWGLLMWRFKTARENLHEKE